MGLLLDFGHLFGLRMIPAVLGVRAPVPVRHYCRPATLAIFSVVVVSLLSTLLVNDVVCHVSWLCMGGRVFPFRWVLGY